MIVNAIRNGLGQFIVCLNCLFKPCQVKRSPEEQAKVDQAVTGWALYQFHRCPFCIKVRRELTRLNVTLELRNTNENEDDEKELMNATGNKKVPALYYTEDNEKKWLKESQNIIQFLRSQFDPKYYSDQ